MPSNQENILPSSGFIRQDGFGDGPCDYVLEIALTFAELGVCVTHAPAN